MNQKTTLEKIKTHSKKIKITNKTLWIGGATVVLLGGGAALWFLMKKKKMLPSMGSISKSLGTQRSTGPCSSRTYPLALGSCHPDVALLQQHLKNMGMDIGTTGSNRDGVDQIFGAKTLAAARQVLGKERFQTSDINTIKNYLK